MIEIESLRCSSSDPPPVTARITAEVDPGLLVDVVDDSLDIDGIRITGNPNEWIVTVNNCSDTGDINIFDVDVHVLDEGEFRFSLTIEPL